MGECSSIVSRYDIPVSLQGGKYILNAKALVGILSVDMRIPAAVVAQAEEIGKKRAVELLQI